jgi:hypothetical protein
LLPSAGSALGLAGRGLEELAGLVVPVDGEGAELGSVLPAVVGAEEELVPTGKLDTDVGLSATTVATVAGGQGAGGDGSGHGGPSFLSFG